jgi:hypothetical protein
VWRESEIWNCGMAGRRYEKLEVGSLKFKPVLSKFLRKSFKD